MARLKFKIGRTKRIAGYTVNAFLKLIFENRFKNTGNVYFYILCAFGIFFSLAVILHNGIDYFGRFLNDDEKFDQITLVGVICGLDRYTEFLNTLKSAIVFQNSTSPKLHIIVFSEYELQKSFNDQFQTWISVTNSSFTYEIRNITHINDASIFKNNRRFLKCTMERLHLQNTLTNINKVLYVDADILFLTPVSDVWSHFQKMNSTQLCGAVADSNEIEKNGYKLSNRIPYYGIEGINAGVLLMDLKKMREINWTKQIIKYAEEYSSTIKMADQDLLNIYFHYYPERMLLLSHRYNVQQFGGPAVTQLCRDCVVHGIRIMHGIFNVFLSKHPATKEEPFHLIYETFSQYVVGTDPLEYLFKPIMLKIKDPKMSSPQIEMMKIYLEHTDTFAFAFPVKTPNFD